MKVIKIFFLFIATLIVWQAVNQYLFCPSYSFTINKPFSGNQWYDPYSTISSGQWIKANFHAHVKAWGGIANGHGTPADVWKGYDSLGYKVHAISNYHNIDEDFKDSANYVSAYEHGYNIKKTHQLVIGGTKVVWLDYIFPQTLSNKQHLLNKLKNRNNIIFTNHPGMRNGYTDDDMRHLTNYDCIEILNPQAISLSQWDAALSSGIPVFGTGDDDMHNVFHPREMGRYCTWLNVPSVTTQNVLTALKKGNGFAMLIGQKEQESHHERQQRISNDLPKLKNFSITGDTLHVEITKPAIEIKFIGQNGKVLSIAKDTSSSFYVLQNTDTYVRTSAKFSDSTELFLNPVFRHTGSPLETKAGFSIKTGETIFFFFLGIVSLVVWGMFIIRSLLPRYFKKGRQ